MKEVADTIGASYEHCDTCILLGTCEEALDLCEALDKEAATTQRMSTRSRTKALREGLEPPFKMPRTSASRSSALQQTSMPEDINYVAMATEVANAAALALDHIFTEFVETYDFNDEDEDEEFNLHVEWCQVFSLLQHPAFHDNRRPALQIALLRCLQHLIMVNEGIMESDMHDDDMLEQLYALPNEQQQLISLIQQPGVAPAVLAAASLALLQATHDSIQPHYAATIASALQAALLASSADEEHVSDIARWLTQCGQTSVVWQVLEPQASGLLQHLLHILQTPDPAEYDISFRANYVLDLIAFIMQQLDSSNNKSAAMQALLKQVEQQTIRRAANLNAGGTYTLCAYLLGSRSGLTELASLAAGGSSMQQVRDAAHGFWQIVIQAW